MGGNIPPVDTRCCFNVDTTSYDVVSTLKRSRMSTGPGGNFLGWNFPGEGDFPGGSLMDGNFPGGNFIGGNLPRAVKDV